MSVRALEFLIPGDLRAATGGYGYDRRIIAGLRALEWRVAVQALDASFPHPTDRALAHAQAILTRLPDQALVLIDGLALGAMPQIVLPHAARLRLLALVHHPLAAESGLSSEQVRELTRSERLALQATRHVIVTSHATRQALQSYDIEAAGVSVVEPGTDAAPLARGARGEVLHMLCVATLTPRKGHDVLFAALARLPPRWHLTCIGSLTRCPVHVARLRAQLQRLGLGPHVTLAGEVPDTMLGQYYQEADLFVLPTRLEGYGMAVAEALAHGLPIVSSQVGAIPQLVGAKAGLLVAPGDADALAATLARILSEPDLLDALAAGAALIRGTLSRWADSCARMSDVLDRDYSTRRTVADDARS
jgi:glycosyltransferase involved in cell wall biosynthesis